MPITVRVCARDSPDLTTFLFRSILVFGCKCKKKEVVNKMSLVSFYGRVAGNEKVTEVDESNGTYLVRWEGSSESARHLRRALEIAAHHMGEYLRQAWGRYKLPWGLKVVIRDCGAVVYGDYPRFPGPGVGGVISDIRKDLDEDASPMAALRNALRIIKACLGMI